MQDLGDGHLERVTTMRYGERSDAVYDAWSTDYEHDLVEQYGYHAPRTVAAELGALLEGRDAQIIDYGCGTGLVGVELRREGFTTIDGVDLAQQMLALAAAKGVYRDLMAADLTAALPIDDARYAALVCVGVMGGGHMAPDHLPELVRTIQPGGPMVFFMNGTTYADDGYADAFATMHDRGVWEIVRTDRVDYMAALTNRPGVMIVARSPSGRPGSGRRSGR